MGLVICENIVNQYNGQVGVNSIYEKGSKFVFSLEIGEVDDKIASKNLYDAYDALMNSEKVKVVVGKFKDFQFDFRQKTPNMLAIEEEQFKQVVPVKTRSLPICREELAEHYQENILGEREKK